STRKASVEQPSPAFELKCAKEREKLRQQITRKLQQDLLALFESESFADFIVDCDLNSKKCHSCLFVKRVPSLYKELLNNFKVSASESCANNTFTRVRIPFSITTSNFFALLRKIYCDDDIRKDEVDLIRRLKNWTMENSANSVQSLNDSELSKSREENSASMDCDVSNLSEEEREMKKPRVVGCTNKLSDSLENSNIMSNSAVNSDNSLTNISFTNDEKINEDESSFVSGNSLDSGDEDNGPEFCGSSSSSQMVRSGTFDLLCQMSLEDALDKNIVKEDEESVQKPNSLNLFNEARICKNDRKVNNNETDEVDFANELDAETPVADPLQPSVPLKSPGSLFQFFVDVDSLPEVAAVKQKQKRSNSSGFMFIDINDCNNAPVASKAEKQFRSSSAFVVDATSKKSVSNNFDKRISQRSNSCQSASPRKLVRNEKVEGIKNEEIVLLPMSPIPRRKRVNQDITSRNNEKYKADAKQISDSGVMSCSWKSDAAKSDSSGNSHTQRVHGVRNQRNRSPSAHDDDSVYSEVSSIDSSMIKERQANIEERIEEQESLLNRTLESCSKLGEDLLKMFFDEINCDVLIEAEDREIKAHRCILVARSPYFAAMFTGEWIESQSNRISLKGFSYNSVHFALCHIYSGAIIIPKDNVNLAELAVLSDLLSLDTLKEVVLYELKKTYCHFFHKPCAECITGVIDCLVLSSECGLHSLYQRCLSWIGKYFHIVWPTKIFAGIHPESLLNACYQSTVNQMTPDNVLETILNCERLATSMPRVKWAEPIFALLASLMEDSCNFVAANNDLVVSSKAFIALGKGRSWNISTLENNLLAAMNSLTPDVGCKTLVQLSNILMVSETESAFGYGPYVDIYVSLVKKMYRHCERYLIHNAGAVANCQSWSLISPEVQQHIKDSAVIVFEFEKPLAPRPKLSSVSRSFSRSKKQETPDLVDRKEEKADRKLRRSPRPKSNSEDEIRPIQKMEYHIYDEVPVECGDKSGETYIEYGMKVGKVGRKPHSAEGAARRSQVAKVSPFINTAKLSNSDICDKGTQIACDSKTAALNDLCAEIDAESSLVNNCLQEAELLEQELTRKLAKQSLDSSLSRHSRARTHLRRNSNDTGSPRNQGHAKQRPSSGTCKPNSNRPPFK
ncbi:uncharacterized protein B4U80_05015, partial [Leptotrombidium deliense]